MLMLVLISVLGAVILGAMGWLIAMGDDGLPAPDRSQPDLGPTESRLSAADVPRLRFRLAFRGYRMSDVDAALARLAESLDAAETALQAAASRRPAARKSAAVDATDVDPPPEPPATP